MKRRLAVKMAKRLFDLVVDKDRYCATSIFISHFILLLQWLVVICNVAQACSYFFVKN